MKTISSVINVQSIKLVWKNNISLVHDLMESYVKLFGELEERWKAFKDNQEDEKFVGKEISNLLKMTLLANLDVSFINFYAMSSAIIASFFSSEWSLIPIALASNKRTKLRR